ncbi:UDP-N-acetylmuramoyl-tripeptide--D-alanyl-D-alanine ligase [Paenibacillus sp. MCAF9]|uniref:UDP-N-acetylmuramoyl-tripeptide--D-alanyl-D- alanine ligase n=1 Tax=Paenibacillus sp. MCAF9 TaxID=3233046 RepID=UPI003F9BA8A1
MIIRSLEEITNMSDGYALQDSVNGFLDQKVHGVSIDTRTIHPGNLYIPIVRIDDGHKYVKQAFEKGAVASLWQADHIPPPEGLPIIIVEDTLKALQSIAMAYRSQLNCKVIAVTGSNGKTTVKDMVNTLLSTTFNVQKTRGNLNGEYGLPLSLLEVRNDTEIVVLEMGMSNKGEIKILSEIAKPDVAIITMIGVSHLSNLGSREQIALAKLEILEGLNSEGTFLFNGDEPLLVKGLEKRGFPWTGATIRFGQSPSNDYFPLKIEHKQSDLLFTLKQYHMPFRLPLLGSHNVANAIAAIAVANLFKIDEEHIQLGLSNLEISGMRMERIWSAKGFLIINDAWNASPISMQAAIETVQNLEGFHKKVLILGDMLELGDAEAAFHEEVARSVDLSKIHSVFTFGHISKIISDTLLENGFEGEAKHFTSKISLTEECMRILSKDDVVLVKGSRGLKLEEVCHLLEDKQQ